MDLGSLAVAPAQGSAPPFIDIIFVLFKWAILSARLAAAKKLASLRSLALSYLCKWSRCADNVRKLRLPPPNRAQIGLVELVSLDQVEPSIMQKCAALSDGEDVTLRAAPEAIKRLFCGRFTLLMLPFW